MAGYSPKSVSGATLVYSFIHLLNKSKNDFKFATNALIHSFTELQTTGGHLRGVEGQGHAGRVRQGSGRRSARLAHARFLL